MKSGFRAIALAAALVVSLPALAQVKVEEAWVRGTVAQQKASGGYMRLTASQDMKLIGASSTAAGLTELHEMRMDGDVMRMRAIQHLDLPAGKVVELKPGGNHVMLMDLKQPLNTGDTVPITLTVEGSDGKRSTVEVKAIVRPLTGNAGHGHGKH